MNERPATFAQLYRLNRLNALTLKKPGAGKQIPHEDADQALAEAAARGLWKPKQPRRVEG